MIVLTVVLLLVASSHAKPDIGYDYRHPQNQQHQHHQHQHHQQGHQQNEHQQFNLNTPQQNNHGQHQHYEVEVQSVPQVAQHHETQNLPSGPELLVQNQYFNHQLAIPPTNEPQRLSHQYLPAHLPSPQFHPHPLPQVPQQQPQIPQPPSPQFHPHPLPPVPQQQLQIPQPSQEYLPAPHPPLIINHPQLSPSHPQIPLTQPQLPHPSPQYLPAQHPRQQVTQTHFQNVLPNVNIQAQQSEQPSHITFEGLDNILHQQLPQVHQQIHFHTEQSQNSGNYLTPQHSINQFNLPPSGQPSRQYLTPQAQVHVDIQKEIQNLPQLPIQSSVKTSQQYLPPQQSGHHQSNFIQNEIPSRQHLSHHSQNQDQFRGNSQTEIHGVESHNNHQLHPQIDVRFQPVDQQQSAFSSSSNSLKTQNLGQFAEPIFNVHSNTVGTNLQQEFGNNQQSSFNVQGFSSLNGGVDQPSSGAISLPNSVLSENEFSSALNTLNSLQSKATLLSGASKGQQEVVKHIYLHGAPDDVSRPPINLPKKKSYNILFIKAPMQTNQPIVQQEIEEKTLVYVLVNKPQDADLSAQQALKTPSKPEVYFIKYKAPNNGKSVFESNNIQGQNSGYTDNAADVAAGASINGLQINSERASGVLRVGDLLPPIVKKKK